MKRHQMLLFFDMVNPRLFVKKTSVDFLENAENGVESLFRETIGMCINKFKLVIKLI